MKANAIYSPSGSTPLDVDRYSNAAASKPFLRGNRGGILFLGPFAVVFIYSLLQNIFPSIVPAGGFGFLAIGLTVLSLSAMGLDLYTSRRAADSVFSRRAFLTQAYAQHYGLALSPKEESDIMVFINKTGIPGSVPVKILTRGAVGYHVAIYGGRLITYTDASGELVAL